MKRNTLVAIFAHPDDEAFFAAGTIAILAKSYDVYIICATRGEAGSNAKKMDKKLGKRRENELLTSARILEVKKVFFLDFIDGTLSNNLYQVLVKEIEKIIEKLQPEIILSFPFSGNTGHLDHIAIAHICGYIFNKTEYIKQLWQVCFLESRAKQVRKYYAHFVYVPPGYLKKHITKVIDISEVWNKKISAICAHKSQISDINQALAEINSLPKEEYLLIHTK